MSVGEEQTECPLCMEPLELDDINFFPCTCGYQICRFCWHRIRTDENGLCPACRKQYPEDPAEFKPLTDDELQRIKKERRQKDLQRKQKAAENRKHLANVRVVQKNLVFVVGLSQRLADPEVLKKNEYFGKFGKIHKVVINHSTSYAGAQSYTQGPSASAYVTYHRPEDTLQAIQAVNNIHVDGRTLKASLGTTKYCSHFLRGSQCPKPDCMYLHELGEEAASFTKEEMQQGKHQEYEQNLYEQFMNCQNLSNNQPPPSSISSTATTTTTHSTKSQRKKTGSPQTIASDGSSQDGVSSAALTPAGTPPISATPPMAGTPPTTCRDAWPTLGVGAPPGVGGVGGMGGGSSSSGTGSPETVPDRDRGLPNGNKSKSSKHQHHSNSTNSGDTNRAPGHHRTKHNSGDHEHNSKSKSGNHSNSTQTSSSSSNGSDVTCSSSGVIPVPSNSAAPSPPALHHLHPHPRTTHSALYGANDSMSLFSSGTGFGSSRQHKHVLPPVPNTESLPPAEIPDTIPVASSTDWQAAFGFTSAATTAGATCTQQPQATSSECHIDDDLGFDPWDESSKALADLIEKEGSAMTSFAGFSRNPPPGLHNHVPPPGANQHKSMPPPGLTPPNHMGPPPNHVTTNNMAAGHMAHNHMGAFNTSMPPPPTGFSGSKILSMMQLSGAAPPPPPPHGPHVHQTQHNHGFNDLLGDTSLPQHKQHNPQSNDVFNMKDWQDGLRALLPNINIHFGTPPYGGASNPPPPPTQPHTTSHTQHSRNDWLSESEVQKNVNSSHVNSGHVNSGHVNSGHVNSSHVSSSHVNSSHVNSSHVMPPADLSWDPAIVTSGNIATDLGPGDSDAQPHWMASLHHLTEESSSSSNHRLPFVQQFPSFNTGVNWAAQSQHPPPGFQPSQLRQHSQTTEPHTQLEAGVQ